MYIHTHTALFVHNNTIALNAEVIGALHTLKIKAIESESCIRKKQVACFLVISFVAWVPSTEVPFCFLPAACKSMLYFISVQSHYGHLSISTEVLHLLLHIDPGWHQGQSSLPGEGTRPRVPQGSFRGGFELSKALLSW